MNETPHENETDTRRRLLDRVGGKGNGIDGGRAGDDIQAMAEAQGQKQVKVVNPDMPEDLERMVKSMLTLVKRRYPRRWRDIVREIDAARV